MARYTPGPWRIERGKVVDKSGNIVAWVPVENRSLAVVREGAGNTHLIATAPELLEAAKMALEVIRHVDGYVYQRAAKVVQLEAVINKTVGKS